MLRHGKTVASGTYCGSGDVPLDDEGRLQVLRIAPFLKTIDVSHCYSSPMVRCLDTFRLLDIQTGCSIEKDLREIDFGSWEGLSFDEISGKDPEKLSEWMKKKEHFTFPQGENILDFSVRIGNCFRKITSTDSKKVLVVCHGGVIRHALCNLLDIPCSKAGSFEITEGSISEVLFEDGHAVLKRLNYCG